MLCYKNEKKGIVALIIMPIILGLCGCVSTPKAVILVEKCTFPNSSDVAPRWVCNDATQLRGFSAVGSSMEEPVSSKQTAVVDARSKLAVSITLIVQKMVDQYVESVNGANLEQIDSVNRSISKFITHETLIGARTLKSRTAPSGVIYVLVGLDDDSVKYIAEYALKGSINSHHEIWSQLNIGDIQNSLVEKIVVQWFSQNRNNDSRL